MDGGAIKQFKGSFVSYVDVTSFYKAANVTEALKAVRAQNMLPLMFPELADFLARTSLKKPWTTNLRSGSLLVTGAPIDTKGDPEYHTIFWHAKHPLLSPGRTQRKTRSEDGSLSHLTREEFSRMLDIAHDPSQDRARAYLTEELYREHKSPTPLRVLKGTTVEVDFANPWVQGLFIYEDRAKRFFSKHVDVKKEKVRLAYSEDMGDTPEARFLDLRIANSISAESNFRADSKFYGLPESQIPSLDTFLEK